MNGDAPEKRQTEMDPWDCVVAATILKKDQESFKRKVNPLKSVV